MRALWASPLLAGVARSAFGTATDVAPVSDGGTTSAPGDAAGEETSVVSEGGASGCTPDLALCALFDDGDEPWGWDSTSDPLDFVYTDAPSRGLELRVQPGADDADLTWEATRTADIARVQIRFSMKILATGGEPDVDLARFTCMNGDGAFAALKLKSERYVQLQMQGDSKPAEGDVGLERVNASLTWDLTTGRADIVAGSLAATLTAGHGTTPCQTIQLRFGLFGLDGENETPWIVQFDDVKVVVE